MNILIISDLHGKLLLPFVAVKILELNKGVKVDYILQCGDVGIFPDLLKLDRATLKHSNTDSLELGFSKYFMKPDPKIINLLDSVGCPMICVRGNHEDHLYLNQLEKMSNNSYFPVDCYNKIFIMKSGEVFSLDRDGEHIKILGIGRIGSADNKKSQRYIQDYERFRLNQISDSEQIDILITHDSALDFITHGFGMIEIREVLDRFEPLYHFFGHTGTHYKKFIDDNGFTTSFKINEMRIMENKSLCTGSMLLLKWINYEDNKVEIINALELIEPRYFLIDK
jgi:Icc-related predicted phosphoesterase